MATNSRHVIVGLLALAVVAGVVLFVSSRDSPSAGEVVDAEFVYFDGSAGSLSDFRGRPLVVNFWASWCPPCAAEMPDFEKVHRELGDRVAFLGLDMQDFDREAALALVAQTGVSYPLAEDPQGEIFSRFGGIAMPTTVFIDSAGRTVRVHGGVLTYEELKRIIETELLG